MSIHPEFCENGMTKHDADYYLKTYGHLIDWTRNKEENVAEIGCADGSITVDVLLTFCSSNIKRIVAIDKSKSMVELARIRNTNPRVTYLEMDASTKHLDENLIEKFGYIFSFDCLHMIADQKQCAKNLFNMLKPGGQIFITFLTYNEIMKTFFTLAANEKWSSYPPLNANFSNYYKLDNPQMEFERIFRDAGFSFDLCEPNPMNYAFTEKEFRRLTGSIDVAMVDVPAHKQKDYDNDYNELLDSLCKRGDEYVLTCMYLVAVVTKPLH